MIGRGVLLDVARAKGVDVLEPGYAINPDDLDAACAHGQRRRSSRATSCWSAPARWCTSAPERLADLVAYTWPSPGLTIETARVVPRPRRGRRGHRYPACSRCSRTQHDDIYLPVHLLHLVEMGLTQGQNWVLDDLAEACADDGRYSFLLDATPLPLTAGLGSPAQPSRAQVAAALGPRRPWPDQFGGQRARRMRLSSGTSVGAPHAR